jgi:hypothetical protein
LHTSRWRLRGCIDIDSGAANSIGQALLLSCQRSLPQIQLLLSVALELIRCYRLLVVRNGETDLLLSHGSGPSRLLDDRGCLTVETKH